MDDAILIFMIINDDYYMRLLLMFMAIADDAILISLLKLHSRTMIIMFNAYNLYDYERLTMRFMMRNAIPVMLCLYDIKCLTCIILNALLA